MWPLKNREARQPWSLDYPLFNLSRDDAFTIGESLEGTLILGATGSGKSTGSGRTLGRSFLAAGYGGLVLTAKADERAVWESYCRDTGRLDDLKIFAPDAGFCFNFLDHELHRKGAGAGHTDNLVALFSQVLQVAERQTGSGGREDEGYWRRALRQLLRNTIDLLIMAKGRITVGDLYRIVVSAATSPEQVNSDGWKSTSLCFQCLTEADGRRKSGRQQHDLGLVADYFLLEFPGLSEKTRSVIVSTFTSMIDVINRGVLYDLFCTETNISPEIIEDGAIVVIDLPVKEYAEVGQFAQVLWKCAFQRSIERRDVAENPRPVFLWADEAQYFVTSPYDMQFQTTCRAARVATVLLSQNINNFYAGLGGGDQGKAESDSIFANLNSKFFHANGDPVTNDWAASIIGRSRQFLTNASSGRAPNHDWFATALGQQGDLTTSCGISEHIDFEVQPRAFTTLRKGGPGNAWEVDAILFQGGRRFRHTGKTWMPVTFSQKR